MRTALLLLSFALTAMSAAAQAPAGAIEGVVRAESDGRPVADAEVTVFGTSRRVRTDAAGRFTLRDLPAGRQWLVVLATGYRPYRVGARVQDAVLRLEIVLPASIQRLPRLDVATGREATREEARSRELFHRFVIPSVTTMSAAEMAAIPQPVAPDVLRSLQALPGMMALNDLDAQLYVRGGSGDQNEFRLDGAPVYGPYHAFGMSGVFSTEAVERVDFFRGARPARHGGALSSVVEIEQHAGGEGDTEAALSMLDTRLAHRGALGGRARFMVAGRRSVTDAVMPDQLPFTYHDAHGRLATAPGAGHQLSLSGFTSRDRFDLFLGGGDGEVRSTWRNGAGSLRWSAPAWRGWRAGASAWASAYDGTLRVGAADSATVTTNTVRATGARAHLERGVLGASMRLGAELDRHDVSLGGTRMEGSYFADSVGDVAVRPSLYMEAERLVGRVRLSPGARLTRWASAGWLVEPRVGARLQFSQGISLTLGASRDHQGMSVLRDERTLLPGAPLWFLHPADAPVSRADAVSAELAAWLDGGWNLGAATFRRWFRHAPHWRPEGTRTLSSVSYDDGVGEGIELSARRFGARASGWLGYAYTRARFTGRDGLRYDAISDRRHTASVNAVGALPWAVQGSTRVVYGTGAPFWPFIGTVSAPRLHAFTPLRRGIEMTRDVPVWSERQMRMPAHFSVDVALRRPFAVRGASVEPYLSVQNVTARPNVFTYAPMSERTWGAGGQLASTRLLMKPESLPFTVLPTAGVHVSF